MAFSIYSQPLPIRQAQGEARAAQATRRAGMEKFFLHLAIGLAVAAACDIALFVAAAGLGLEALGSRNLAVLAGVNLAIILLAVLPGPKPAKVFPFGVYYVYGLFTTLPMVAVVGLVVGVVALPIILLISLFAGGDAAFAAIYTWYARVWLAVWLVFAGLKAYTEIAPRMSK